MNYLGKNFNHLFSDEFYLVHDGIKPVPFKRCFYMNIWTEINHEPLIHIKYQLYYSIKYRLQQIKETL